MLENISNSYRIWNPIADTDRHHWSANIFHVDRHFLLDCYWKPTCLIGNLLETDMSYRKHIGNRDVSSETDVLHRGPNMPQHVSKIRDTFSTDTFWYGLCNWQIKILHCVYIFRIFYSGGGGAYRRRHIENWILILLIWYS